MKKTNFTTIQPSWCLGSNWLRGLIPLLALFMLALPMQTHAQQPNWGVFCPAINEDGEGEGALSDFVTNLSQLNAPVKVVLYNQWGGPIRTFNWNNINNSTRTQNVCSYLGKTLRFSVETSGGICTLGSMILNGTPGVVLTSGLGTKVTGEHVDTGKINVYCGTVIPTSGNYVRTATAPCGGRATAPVAQPDWIMPFPCNVDSDTAEVIFRTWESYDKEGNLATLTDTIVVFRLPRLSPNAFIGSAEDSFYCELEAVPSEREALKRYASWKQPVGLHDYERPYSKLRGVTYEIPATIIIAGLTNAFAQGFDTYQEYLDCVILRKANGVDSVTIRDIVSGDYASDLINNATDEQRTYGFLQILIELNEKPINVVLEALLEFYPYLLLQEGDWILSEGGNFEQVTSDWFFNGNGNSPYWFAGGWPSIYGTGDCVRFCDVGAESEFGCIEIQVPVLTIDGFSADSCDTICLPTGTHCGITIKTDEIADWTGSCPQTRGVDSWITQTCWALTPNLCAEQVECGVPFVAEEGSIVIDYSCTDKAVKAHISQWQTLYDTIPPIFDFCYPTFSSFEQLITYLETEATTIEQIAATLVPLYPFISDIIGGGEIDSSLFDLSLLSIQDSIREGSVHPVAAIYEMTNPTTFRVGSHDCVADVFVPDVQVIDNCSGVHSVKAMVEV